MPSFREPDCRFLVVYPAAAAEPRTCRCQPGTAQPGAASSVFLGLELADNRLKHHGHVGVVDIEQQPQDVDLIAGKSQSPVEINIGSAYVCTGGVNQQVPGLEVRFGWCVEGVLSGFFALELRVCLDYV